MSAGGGHIPEHDLLELVEGTLPPEREAAVRAAVARDPRLGQLVARLRADRRALMSLGAVRAPAGLAERVEAAMEREMLLGLGGDDAALTGPIPVSRLRPKRAPLVVRAWRSPVGRGLAVAAGLALLVGGGYIAVMNLSPGLPSVAPGTTGPVASNDDGVSALLEDEPAQPVTSIAAAPEAEPALEVGEPEGAADGLEVAVAAEDLHGPPLPPEGATEAPAIATAAPQEPEPMSPRRALELARRGKLAIVIRGPDPAAAAAGVEALARASSRPGGAGVWERLDGGAGSGTLARGYETIAALWSPAFVPELAAPGSPWSPIVASREIEGEGPFAPAPLGIGVSLPLGVPAWRPPLAAAPAAVWAVGVEDREATLVSLLGALARKSLGERAEFVELPVAIDAPPPADPDAVLWWTQPAAAWGWRLSVPVIVEGSPQ
jgi:hypothetical protein